MRTIAASVFSANLGILHLQHEETKVFQNARAESRNFLIGGQTFNVIIRFLCINNEANSKVDFQLEILENSVTLQ